MVGEMSVIWEIDPALAGPPLSADARAASRKALRERLDATTARIDKQVKANADEARAKAEALAWLRSALIPKDMRATMPRFLREYLWPPKA